MEIVRPSTRGRSTDTTTFACVLSVSSGFSVGDGCEANRAVVTLIMLAPRRVKHFALRIAPLERGLTPVGKRCSGKSPQDAANRRRLR